MKLFPKLALIILLLILIQSSLTGYFVSRIISNNNLQDAKIELRQKADFISSNYNSWKRHLWKQLHKVRAFSENPGKNTLTEKELTDLLTSSSLDAVIVKTGNNIFSIGAISTSSDFVLPPEDLLVLNNNHPTIRLFRFRSRFYMIGSISVSKETESTDIYLVKHINDSFLKNIVFDTDGIILFHTRNQILTGHFSNQNLVFQYNKNMENNSYQEYYALEHEGETFNMATSRAGYLEQEEGQETVYLTTILSNEPYNRRIRTIERTVITVSLFIMLITTFLSLLIARSITRPVTDLANAMSSLKSGAFDIRLQSGDNSELGVLMRGFNNMAARLNQDKLKIDRSLNEITFLNEFNEGIIHAIRDAIAVVDETLLIIKSNPSFEKRFFNGPRNSEKTLRSINSSAFDETVLQNITEVLTDKKESWTCRVRDRQDRIYELKTYPVHGETPESAGRRMCVLLMEDISEKNAYEEKILQAEKLSSLSMLSAGISHEINNPLTSIITNTQNLIYDETDPEKLDSLKLVEEEAVRIAQIIRDLMNFTSREEDLRQVIHPEWAVREVIRLIQHSRRPDGRRVPPIEIISEPDLPGVIISRGELMQILINLLQNAIQATENEEAVTVELKNLQNQVELCVRDRGCGIPQEKLKRVFDPFYTTKSNREGTGLGLSVVYGIIMKYRGSIRINSESGTGTEMIFTLPTRRDDEHTDS